MIGVADRADALRHDHGGGVQFLANGTAKIGVGLIVKRRGGIVKHQNFGACRKRSRDQNALALTARHVRALGGEGMLVGKIGKGGGWNVEFAFGGSVIV
jgi:hypothetical protein